jgi:Ser/Thr protein kinase RdoA (MazF antagonist)
VNTVRVRLGEFEVECGSVDELRVTLDLLAFHKLVEHVDGTEVAVATPVALQPVASLEVKNPATTASADRFARVTAFMAGRAMTGPAIQAGMPREFGTTAAAGIWLAKQAEAGRMERVSRGYYRSRVSVPTARAVAEAEAG